ncbi:MAG: LLM class F420-dependent oxidoreductase [Acidimicrobiaceae bacterium]|nr:LLM class F420-dependent oxidoreductase [Acidimicrobiaceae bacterium]HAQ44348.1 LLM class F420-dependent oxidoreductase [Acidimicrobiaceae bacterium]|tara:strand:- start:2318 stop:3190 length:873 start_codon:yes stop_codon:yes gene_type:complete
MKFGLRYCNTDKYAANTALAVELVQAGEEAGFESAWTVEHTVIPSGYESVYPYSESGKIAGGAEDLILPDPLIWMAHMAGATTSIKFGTAILILPQHSPVVCAAQVATLDYMSGGRALLGIGVGWLKEEFDAIGAPFERRGIRTDEYVAAMRALWANDCASFEGEFVQFKDTYCLPRPINGSVPIIVGGDTDYAARRAGRLGDGYFPARDTPQERIDLARRTAEQCGRDPDALEITMPMPEDPDDIPNMKARGVDRLVVPVTAMAGMPTLIDSPEDALRFGEIIAKYADL